MKAAFGNRRHFLQMAAATGAIAGLGDFSFLGRLRPVSAAEAAIASHMVQFDPDIEPLVRLLEETPREKVIEAFASRIQEGTSYQEVLAALLLAGVRNVQPRPSVGFKFHAVLVVNSAHLASLASPDSERWLPIFWALDYFKSAQASDEREGDWTMAPVKESALPPAHQAHDAFRSAMDRWDVEAADVAVASLARSAGANELFELFAHYGARDYRSIGHKAIFVANAFRTLQCIGWRYAEPVLRSLAYALLAHTNEPNPAENDLAPDRSWRINQQLAGEISAHWLEGKPDNQATTELLKILRSEPAEAASRAVVEMLNRGVAVQSIYDALLVGSGELLMRQPAIVALHAVTTTNAIHYAFQTARDEQTRRMLLLQNAAFLPQFRESMQGRGSVADIQIDQISAEQPATEQPIVEVFADVNGNTQAAAAKLLGYLNSGGSPESVVQAARRLIFLKGTDSHDYKFSSAVLEDFYAVSPEWRNRFLASSVYKMRGSAEPDNALVQRTRDALRA